MCWTAAGWWGSRGNRSCQGPFTTLKRCWRNRQPPISSEPTSISHARQNSSDSKRSHLPNKTWRPKTVLTTPLCDFIKSISHICREGADPTTPARACHTYPLHARTRSPVSANERAFLVAREEIDRKSGERLATCAFYSAAHECLKRSPDRAIYHNRRAFKVKGAFQPRGGSGRALYDYSHALPVYLFDCVLKLKAFTLHHMEPFLRWDIKREFYGRRQT